MNDKQFLWVEKYRPTTLDEYLGNDFLKARIGTYIASGDIPHLLFSGKPGTGKTTLAKIIATSIHCDYKYINASDENSVDTVRTKIKDFASVAGFSPLKIIILDEADYITLQAQMALRNLMETYAAHTRFILTCNYAERIAEPLMSRTQQYQIQPLTKADVAKYVANILKQESVQFHLDDFKLLVDAHYPDIRKIINECQLHNLNGWIEIHHNEIVAADYKLKILDVLKSKDDKKKKFQEIRQILANAHTQDFLDFYTLLYEKAPEIAPEHISQVILVVAEGLRDDVLARDKEINAMATLIKLLQIN